MADPQHRPVMDGFDRLTVRLYRGGLVWTAVALAAAGVALCTGRTHPAIWVVVYVGIVVAALNMHLYDKRVRWVIRSANGLGGVLLLGGLALELPLVLYAGLGFAFVALSGFALKEQFCFRIPGLRAVPVLLAASLIPLTLGALQVAGAILLIGVLPLGVLAIAKLRMPLDFDIGDKSRYQV